MMYKNKNKHHQQFLEQWYIGRTLTSHPECRVEMSDMYAFDDLSILFGLGIEEQRTFVADNSSKIREIPAWISHQFVYK